MGFLYPPPSTETWQLRSCRVDPFFRSDIPPLAPAPGIRYLQNHWPRLEAWILGLPLALYSSTEMLQQPAGAPPAWFAWGEAIQVARGAAPEWPEWLVPESVSTLSSALKQADRYAEFANELAVDLPKLLAFVAQGPRAPGVSPEDSEAATEHRSRPQSR